jgi:IS5 family transposase
MREIIQQQMPLVPCRIEHDHATEIEAISRILDSLPEAAALVYADLIRFCDHPEQGREGMTAEQVLRAIVVKQMHDFSYEDLAFHIADSRSFGTFCRFGIGDDAPSRSGLQRSFKLVRPETMEAINRMIVARSRERGVENGRKIRVDCTVTKTNIHEPTDSSLLWDCNRVLCRIMARARDEFGIEYNDHRLAARRRYLEVFGSKNPAERTGHYLELLRVTLETLDDSERVAVILDSIECADGVQMASAKGLAHELRKHNELSIKVVEQTQRRVVNGESVPAGEKIVSIFEPHTDIIVKDRRETQYGHKLCLSAGASGLITDCVVEDGNPADATLAVRMIERHKEIFGQVPRQTSMDGGFASKSNLDALKQAGVKDVAFSKKRGLPITDMVRSSWVYRRLRDFRAGIEGMISFLKRCFGMRCCTWRGLVSYKSYVWSSIMSANLLLLARHELAVT